jgi:hypothetical protein
MIEDMKREVEKGQGKEQDSAAGITEDILQSPVTEKEGEKKKDEKDRRRRNAGDGGTFDSFLFIFMVAHPISFRRQVAGVVGFQTAITDQP